MAMNPQSVMSSLRMMSDQQLQQYAAMHKNDPFVFPLAFQESQTRKQMRAESQQAQQAPQGKVVDQDLAQMAPEPLPEEVGIGALPAQNIEGMCGGGIVAFEEGGEVPRFQVGGTPPSAGTEFGIPGMVSGAPILPQAGYKDPSEMTTWEKIQAYRRARQAEREAYQRGQRAPAAATYTPSSMDPFAYDQAALPMPTQRVAAPVADKISGASRAAPAADTGAQLRPGGGQGFMPGQGLPGLTQTATGTAQELQAMRDQMGSARVDPSVQAQIDKYAQAKKEAGEQALAELEADIAKQGKGMEGAEARAQARGEKLAKREVDLPAMALMEAGFAIMSGSSPFALQNIGAGAQVGMKSYASGIEKLQEARDKLDESFDKIEQFRMNRADMNSKEIRAAKADIRNTQSEAQKMGLDALMKDTDMNRADARAGFEVLARNRATMYEAASRERLGLAQIASHERTAGAGSQLGLFKALGGGDPAKGLGVYAGVMGPEARGVQGLLAKYADPVKLMTLKSTDPDLYNYVRAQLSMQMMPGVMSTPTGEARP